MHFDYSEQFKDLKIDLSSFLKRFSTENYKLKFSNLQPVKVNVKNLFEQYKILDAYKRDFSTFTTYKIQPNELLENISFKFYDAIEYWWLIALFNNIRNPFFDMPLTEEQIIEYSKELETAEGKYPQNVYYKLIEFENEKRREIHIPKKEAIADIVWDYRQAIMKEQQRMRRVEQL